MSISFKKFTQFIDLEGTPSDEQINELFGVFKNNNKIEKLRADRDKLKADTAAKVAAWRKKKAGIEDDEDDEDDQPKNQQRKPMATPSQAAAGRAAERDWMKNMATEAVSKVSDFSKMVKLLKQAGITGRKQVNEVDIGKVSTEFVSDKSEKENIQLMKDAGFEIVASYGAFDLWENDAEFKIQMERSKSFRVAPKNVDSSNFRSKVLSQRDADE